jgi:hypothetical protein
MLWKAVRARDGELRMTGEPDELAWVLHELGKVLDVAHDGRTYAQCGGFGVRT